MIGIHERYMERKYRVSQIFPGNPSSFEIRIPKGWTKNISGWVMIHAGYMCQPASLKLNVSTYSVKYIIGCLEACSEYWLHAVVTHPGSGNLDNLVKVLDCIADWKLATGNNIPLLLENDTQGGQKVGSVKNLVTLCENEKYKSFLKICLDTAHLYASKDPYDQVLYDNIDELVKYAGKYIYCLHLNTPDPSVKRGSGLDKHKVSITEGPQDFNPHHLVGLYKKLSCNAIVESCIHTDVEFFNKYAGL